MSEPPLVPTRTAAFAPARNHVLGLGLATVVAAVLTIVIGWPGRILLLALNAILLAETVRLTVVRPVLSANTDGLRVHRLGGTSFYPWSAIRSIEPRSTRRLVTVRTLELDLDESIVVLPAYRLGVCPTTAAEELGKIRARTE